MLSKLLEKGRSNTLLTLTLILLLSRPSSLIGMEKDSGEEVTIKYGEASATLESACNLTDDKNKNQTELKAEFFEAIKNANTETIIKILDTGFDIDTQGEHGFTALHLASRYGHIEIIELLLNRKADIHACNKNDNTPLHAAAYGNQAIAIKLLIKNGAQYSATNKNGDTPLHSAAWKNNVLAIETLIEEGANTEMQNNDGETPLHLAAWNNSILALNSLIKNGAQLTAKNNENQIPLQLAQKKEHAQAALRLQAFELSQRIKNKSDALKKILSDYQTYEVSTYEINRALDTLEGLNEKNMYLNAKKINSAAVMLPSNLPLYSLILFGIIPASLSEKVVIRPNTLLQDANIISRICDELEIESLYPHVSVVNTNHVEFKSYIKVASLVVFTGKPSNADEILKEMKHDAILVLNGSGHNPVVVTESADVNKAIDDSLMLKGFNGGQDCAGPDAILVHEDVAEEFIQTFQKKYSSLKTGEFTDPETIIGPINRFSELQKFAQIFHDNKKDILSGGTIDYKNNIVSPTTIVRGIDRYPNYKEMFGPIAFIHPYKNDADLKYYFDDNGGQYKLNRMYVTVYGFSKYIAERDDVKNPYKEGNVGIVLTNQTIHDVEIGYKPYGGYSIGASNITKKTIKGIQKLATPILIPHIIAEYLIKNQDLPIQWKEKKDKSKVSISSVIKSTKEVHPILQDFQTIAQEEFKEDLIFGFVFGSAAKGKLKSEKDDLDTFICTKKDSPEVREKYLNRLADLHNKYNLKVDKNFPAEIVSIEKLKNSLKTLDKIEISVDEKIEDDKFDQIFWLHALTDKKIGFIGDGKAMFSLIKSSAGYIPKWRDQIIEQLNNKETLPEHVRSRFIGLNKQEIIEKLSKQSAHLVVHLGLNYDTENKE